MHFSCPIITSPRLCASAHKNANIAGAGKKEAIEKKKIINRCLEQCLEKGGRSFLGGCRKSYKQKREKERERRRRKLLCFRVGEIYFPSLTVSGPEKVGKSPEKRGREYPGANLFSGPMLLPPPFFPMGRQTLKVKHRLHAPREK